MNPNAKKRIHLIYSIVLSAMLGICGLLLMGACVQIFLSGGEQTYTPAKVAIAFGYIDIPVYICLGMIVVSFLLQLILRQPEQAVKIKQPGMQLRRLQLTRDPGQADAEKQANLRHLRGIRRALHIIYATLCILYTGLFLFFALVNITFYPEPAQATDYVISLMPIFVPYSTVALGFGVLTAYLIRKNSEKQIELYKQFPPAAKKTAERKQTAVHVVRYSVLALSLALIVFGLVTGGWEDVLTKAVNICTECVGLG